MTNTPEGKERREFLRFDFKQPFKYNTINVVKSENIAANLATAIAKNLSASGILFITDISNVPNISSLLVLDVDYKIASICEEIENHVLILDNKIIGRVVRIEDNADGTCGVGVAFVTNDDIETPDIKDIRKLIKK